MKGGHLEDKIRVYVSSLEISTLDYVDKDSIGHPCVTSRHGENVFTGFKHLPKGSWNGYLTDDQMKAIDVVGKFCEENELEYEVVDMANMSFMSKMKFMFKGIKAPTITFKGAKIEGVPTKEDLEVLTAK
jgi:hypothetical protein